jgi:hypothetical protein
MYSLSVARPINPTKKDKALVNLIAKGVLDNEHMINIIPETINAMAEFGFIQTLLVTTFCKKTISLALP